MFSVLFVLSVLFIKAIYVESHGQVISPMPHFTVEGSKRLRWLKEVPASKIFPGIKLGSRVGGKDGTANAKKFAAAATLLLFHDFFSLRGFCQ